MWTFIDRTIYQKRIKSVISYQNNCYFSGDINILWSAHYSIVKCTFTRKCRPDRLSSESSSSSSSSSSSRSSSSSSSSSPESSDSLLAGRPAVGLHVPGIPTPGIPTPGILTPGIPIPDSPPRNKSTRDCTRWFWEKPFQAAKGSACPCPCPCPSPGVCPLPFGVLFFLDPWPVAWGEVVEGCDGAPAWAGAWVLLAPVLRLTGIDPASGSHWGDLPWEAESLRGLVMRAKGASWVVLWMTPLGWWGSGSPSRALERKRLEWLFWGGGGGAGGNGDEDRDVLLGDLFGPCCCFFSSAGNVCPWDMRVWEWRRRREGENKERQGVSGEGGRGNGRMGGTMNDLEKIWKEMGQSRVALAVSLHHCWLFEQVTKLQCWTLVQLTVSKPLSEKQKEHKCNNQRHCTRPSSQKETLSISLKL